MAPTKKKVSRQTGSGADLKIDEVVDWNDDQMEAAFHRLETLPLSELVNTGAHSVDIARHEIFNDANWKGFLPKGSVPRQAFEHLSTGYAKRFWKEGRKYLGETLYLSGRILVQHSLEEVTTHERMDDGLAPGRYIILHYTDPIFEHIFHDVIKAVTPTLILYRGYNGRFPNGKRGFSAPLIRRFTFRQMGTVDHGVLFKGGSVPGQDDLAGRWRLDAVATSNLPAPAGQIRVTPAANGRIVTTYEAGADARARSLPSIVAEHFNRAPLATLQKEVRLVDRDYAVGRWTTNIRGPFARLLLGGGYGLFHVEKSKSSSRRFTFYYMLTRQ